jgi:Protein of unknown function (DUF3224)
MRARTLAGIALGLWLPLGGGSPIDAQGVPASPAPARKEAAMTAHASGTFEVKLTPEATEEGAEGSTLGRYSLDKRFHGDLEGTGKGEMLSAGTGIQGSAGYVAIERVSGTLAGRSGTFVLQHSGTMTRGEGKLTVTVVPDSGTGELVGIAGAMAIDIRDGKHFYQLDYTLPDRP